MSLIKDTIEDEKTLKDKELLEYEWAKKEKLVEEADQARRADLEELERDNQLER